MRRILLAFGFFLAFATSHAQEPVYSGNYELASRFSPEKLKNRTLIDADGNLILKAKEDDLFHQC